MRWSAGLVQGLHERQASSYDRMMRSVADPWPTPKSKRERTRRSLLLAAERVFESSSVERAKVEDIAAAAGVSTGTLYLYFSSKHELAIAYLDAVFDLLDTDLETLKSESSPIRRVLGAGEIYLRHVIDFPVASRMASVRAAYPPNEHRGTLAEKLDKRMVTTLMGVAVDLKASMDSGEVPSAPVDEAMLFVWSAWHGMATLVARCDQLTLPPEMALRALARGRRMLLAGLQIEELDSQPRDSALAPDKIGH